jgi:hypothetical protein
MTPAPRARWPIGSVLLRAVAAVTVAAFAALASTETCFYQGETTTDNRRLCNYYCPSGDMTITIGTGRDCPTTIDVWCPRCVRTEPPR